MTKVLEAVLTKKTENRRDRPPLNRFMNMNI